MEATERHEIGEASPLLEEAPSWVPPVPPEGLGSVLFDSDERSARDDLRVQIAALEAELGRLFGDAFPRHGIDFRVSAPGGGPRLLSVSELERLRDSLAGRVRSVRTELGRRTDAEQLNRGLIERMAQDPEGHKWVRVSNEDVGEPGCRHWHSRPRWGILGMALGWWRVKVSSGCPLAAGVAPPPAHGHQEAAKAQAAPWSAGRTAGRDARGRGRS